MGSPPQADCRSPIRSRGQVYRHIYIVMRIGIDIRALMEGKTTGVPVYITNLLRTLFVIDKENEYVLFGNSFGPSPFLPLPQKGERAGVRGNVKYKLFRYPNKLFMPSQRFLGWPKIDKMLGGVDLFFSPHWRVAALSKNIPLVVTFHDLSFEVIPEFFTMRQRLWHQFMNYRQAARRAAKIVAVSKNTRQDLIDLYGVPESKIEVIYPGCGNQNSPFTPSFPPKEDPPLAEIKEGEGGVHVAEAFSAVGGSAFGGRTPMNKNYFLYFGTFEPRKNVAAVLEAYEAYYRQSRVKRPLFLAGSAGWKTKLKIPARLRGQIFIKQNTSEAERQRLFADAFGFLFLSFYEGFGFPVLEAASVGLPVISSFATSLSEIASDFALLVNPFRPSQVAEAMLALEEDERLYQSLKNKGLQAAKEFTWEKTAKQTLELFKRICASE